MKILAFDPGTTHTAYVEFHALKNINNFGKLENEKIYQEVLLDRIDQYDYVAIEMIASYGMPVGKEVFETCLWIGRFMQGALDLEKSVKLVYRKDVKIHLCGTNKAKDGNIRQALIDRLGIQGTKKNPGITYGISGDIWAALAVAVYARDTWTK